MSTQKNNNSVTNSTFPQSWVNFMKDLHKAKNSGRLVIFVGSGVSCNSGLPTWGKLIDEFVKELRISKESLSYPEIAQYYYDKYKAKKYKNKIEEILGVPVVPNPIDKIIFELNPRHIVTTNYDKLLEQAQNESSEYTPIIQDGDFVDSQKHIESSFPKYLIKMHGDIDDVETIILKEEDYLHYELSHPLMCTYLKALLANYSFLFIGYSLSDYNLKQILEWLNYVTKKVKNKREHFIVQVSSNKQKRYTVKVQDVNTTLEYDCIKIIQEDENNEPKNYFVNVCPKNDQTEQQYYFVKSIQDRETQHVDDNNSDNLDDYSSQEFYKPTNHILNSEYSKNKQEYEYKRLQRLRINLVNLNEDSYKELGISREEMPTNPNDSSKLFFENNKLGEVLFLCLYHLRDYEKFMNRYCVQDYLNEKTKVLCEYERISMRDILPLFKFHRDKAKVSINRKINRNQCFINLEISPYFEDLLEDSEFQQIYFRQYKRFFAKFQNKSDNGFIQRSNIEQISVKKDKLSSSFSYNLSENNDELFNMYLDNDYVGIKKRLDDGKDSQESVLFYRILLNDFNFDLSYFEKTEEKIKEQKSQASQEDVFQKKLARLLVQIRKYEFYHKFDMDGQKEEKDKLSKYIDSIDDSVTSVIKYYYIDIIKLENLSKGKTGKEDINTIDGLTFIYDFYFFIFKNHFPFFGNDAQNPPFESFIEELFKQRIEELEDLDYQANPYIEINEIDFDILVKYSDSEKLENTLKEKCKKGNASIPLKIEGELFLKFENLCKSLFAFSEPQWNKYAFNFVLLWTYTNTEQLEIDANEITKVSNSIIDMCGCAYDQQQNGSAQDELKTDDNVEESVNSADVLKEFLLRQKVSSADIQKLLNSLGKRRFVFPNIRPILFNSYKQN